MNPHRIPPRIFWPSHEGTATTLTRLMSVTAGAALIVACADVPAGVEDGPRRLPVAFTEEFRIGDDPDEHQFSRVSEMAFAPDGRLVVLDTEAFNVTVYDTEGNQVEQWGREGEGPGEFPNPPGEMAMSDNGTLAIETFTRLDLFTIDGNIVDSRLVTPLRIRNISFYAGDSMVVLAERGRQGDDSPVELIRLADGDVLWSSPPIVSILGTGPFSMWQAVSRFGVLWDGNVAVGMSDAYDLQVIEASTGQTAGRIVRTVPMRGPSDSFMETLREETREIYGEDSPIYQRLAPSHPFPMVTNVVTGPPDRTIWVGRGTGIDDELAPPVGESMDDWEFHHYDLFDGDSYEYIGTIDIPEDLILLTGNATHIAGFTRGPFGIHSVRVLRVEIER